MDAGIYKRGLGFGLLKSLFWQQNLKHPARISLCERNSVSKAGIITFPQTRSSSSSPPNPSSHRNFPVMTDTFLSHRDCPWVSTSGSRQERALSPSLSERQPCHPAEAPIGFRVSCKIDFPIPSHWDGIPGLFPLPLIKLWMCINQPELSSLTQDHLIVISHSPAGSLGSAGPLSRGFCVAESRGME